MTQEKKERVGILMPPSQVKEIDALYSLHGHTSRSEFVCKAVEFYTGFLNAGSSEAYMDKTTLAFLEDQFGKLEARICRQLFRMCVELGIASHLFAVMVVDASEEQLAELRKTCVKDIKKTVGNIRFDGIYNFQHQGMGREDDYDEEN